jgi:hypothetical protein
MVAAIHPMSRRLVIFVLALAVAGSFIAPVRAENSAEVVYDDGRPAERVPLFRVSGDDDVWFLRANDVARLFRATQFWNASTRKIVLGIGRARFVLTVDTRVVVVDGEPFMMRTPTRYEDGFVMVPMEFMLEIAAQQPRSFRWTRRLHRAGIGQRIASSRLARAPPRPSIGRQLVYQ